MKKEFKLIENSSLKQLEKIVHHRKIINKGKIKTVYSKDFIKKIVKNYNPNNIIYAEIFKKVIKLEIRSFEIRYQ